MATTDADAALLAWARAATAISMWAADRVGEVSPVQLRALTALSSSSASSLRQLAAALGVTVQSAGRLVDRLVATGLVERRPGADARGGPDVQLTDRGRELVAAYDAHQLEHLRVALDAVAPPQRLLLLDAMTAMSDSAARASLTSPRTEEAAR